MGYKERQCQYKLLMKKDKLKMKQKYKIRAIKKDKLRIKKDTLMD